MKFISFSYQKSLCIICICLISVFSLHAQYNIVGDTSANINETKTYSVEDSSGNPPPLWEPNSGAPYIYTWVITGGVVTNSTDPYATITITSTTYTYTTDSFYGGDTIDVEWKVPGQFQEITVTFHEEDFNPLYITNDMLYVNVSGTYPSRPDTPIWNKEVCSAPLITRQGTPQNGDIWYWQGKDASGEHTNLGSGTTYVPNEGSGTYYIRALGSNGLWSLASTPVEVNIISTPIWYADTDGDGFGDPNSTPITSCTQPSGYVSNNFDECPTQSGNLLNNGCSGTGDLGTSNKNYVHTITPLIEVSDASQITNDDDKLESVTYFDGLGRTIQNVAIRAGGQGQDIKSPVVYDQFGRQAITYLPHATVTSDVSSYTNNTTLISGLNAYYVAKHPSQLNSSTPNAYVETHYDDASPLGRVLETGGPGETWAVNTNSDNDHTTKLEFNTNSENEVYDIDYSGDGQTLSITNYYAAGELLKNTTKNTNWITSDGKVNTKELFVDKSGRKIAEYSYIIEGTTLQRLITYYVYDDVGNLVYVLTPKIFSILSGTTITVTNLNDLAFQYKYDIYNRQIEQKVPGKKLWEYMVYDSLDRPILTQDNNLREDNKWAFIKYDVFGRAIYSGIYTSTLSRTALQTAVDNYINANTNNQSNIESRTTNTSSIGGISINYSNNAYPITNLEVLTVNYFDDYTFTDSNKPTTPIAIQGQVVTTRTNGLTTGTWTKTLDAATWAKSYTYYDEKGRIIYVHEKNHLGGYTNNESKLDFKGKVEGSITQHKRLASDNLLTIKDYFTYDHVERPISHTQSIGGTADLALDNIELDDTAPTTDQNKSHTATNSITLSPDFIALPGFQASIQALGDRELISLQVYDELGQLTTKKIGGNTDVVIANSNGLQTIDYKYDIRGTLKGVNDVDAIGNDLFAFELNYETGEGTNFTSSDAQYNGNISQMLWKSAQNSTKKSYLYTYDDLNRFTRARYGEGTSLASNFGKFEANVTGYDANGNITGITRRGGVSGTTIDNLTYAYDTGQGNQLMKVTDASGTMGFNNGISGTSNDYVYDDNGNLIQDLNKDISNIEYNHLDLVTKVTFNDGKRIEFVYNATGTKLQMAYVNGSTTTTTDYIGGFQYENSSLQFIPSTEGYISPEIVSGSVEYDYVYVLKDHLGNNRIAFKDINKDNVVTSTDILSSTDYYPMGLTHYGEYVANSNYNFKYQGKEQLLANNYNMYDFGSRMFDTSVGRWFNTDPQNQFSSPYLAMANNPVMVVDPDGELAWFVPIVIGAVIGGGSAAIQNPRADFGDILTGSAIGAVGGFTGIGVTSAVAGTALTATIGGATGLGAVVAGGAAGGFVSGGVSSVVNGGGFLGGAWRGALTGAAGGYFNQFGGGSLTNNLAWGTAGGAASGAFSAAINGNNVADGALFGAAMGAGMSLSFSLYESVRNGVQGCGFGTNDGVFDKLAAKAFSNNAVDPDRAQEALDFWVKRMGGPELKFTTYKSSYTHPTTGDIFITHNTFRHSDFHLVRTHIAHEHGHYYKDINWEDGKVGGKALGWNDEAAAAEIYERDGVTGYNNAIQNSGRYQLTNPKYLYNGHYRHGRASWDAYEGPKSWHLLPRRY